MSDYDAVFYYASGETADFPPQAADFYSSGGLVADQLSLTPIPTGGHRLADSVPITPTTMPQFVPGSNDGRASNGEDSKMPVHLGSFTGNSRC